MAFFNTYTLVRHCKERIRGVARLARLKAVDTTVHVWSFSTHGHWQDIVRKGFVELRAIYTLTISSTNSIPHHQGTTFRGTVLNSMKDANISPEKSFCIFLTRGYRSVSFEPPFSMRHATSCKGLSMTLGPQTLFVRRRCY